jgi:hypothetical protein
MMFPLRNTTNLMAFTLVNRDEHHYRPTRDALSSYPGGGAGRVVPD